MNYEKLEGREVVINNYSSKLEAIVAGFNKDIGLTLVRKETGDPCFCLICPRNPLFSTVKENSLILNRKLRKLCARMILSGEFSVEKVEDLIKSFYPNYIGGIVSKEVCPFNQ